MKLKQTGIAAKVVKRVDDIKELAMTEEIKIYEGSRNGEVINERQSLNLPQPWKYVLRQKAVQDQNNKC